MRIPDQIVSLIKASAHLKEIMQSDGHKFKGNKCCCPFHNENTPSLSVFTAQNKYKCFGCGVFGDTINYLEKYHNLNFVQALTKLAEINHQSGLLTPYLD